MSLETRLIDLAQAVGADIKELESRSSGIIGPAGGDLSGTYPNPTVVKASGPSMTINGRLLIPTPGSTAGILLGPDASLYRHSVLMLRTNSSFYADGHLATIGGDVQITNNHGALRFGVDSDTTLYRAAAEVLKTDSQLWTTKALYAQQGTSQMVGIGIVNGQAGIILGSAADTNLYRSAAGWLKTDGNFFASRIWAADSTNDQVIIGGVAGGGIEFGRLGDASIYRNGVALIRTNAALKVDGKLNVGLQSPLSTALLSVVGGGNDIEFGHQNPAGYRSTLGANMGGGQPFLAFNAEAGTATNTFRTRGIRGILLQAQLDGSLDIQGVDEVNADNQTPVVLANFSADGDLYVSGKVIGKGAVPLGGTIGQILAKKTATDHDTEWIAPPSGGTTSVYRSGGSGSVASVGAAWAALNPRVAGVVIEPAGAFVENTDNTITIVQAGWYDVEVTASTQQVYDNGIHVGLSTAPGGSELAMSGGRGSASTGANATVASAIKFTANQKLYINAYAATATNMYITRLTITRIGAGPAGPVGATGNNAEIYEQASEPVGAGVGAIWVDTDEAPATGGNLPLGGTTGQVLTKTASTDYTAGWQTPAVPPTPPAIPAGRGYTGYATNQNRNVDARSTTLDNVANALAWLIEDMKGAGLIK